MSDRIQAPPGQIFEEYQLKTDQMRPFQERGPMDAGVLITLRQISEALKIPLMDLLRDPTARENLKNARLSGYTHEPNSNVLGAHITRSPRRPQDKGKIFLRPQPEGIGKDAAPGVLDTILHELIHADPDAYHSNKPNDLFEQLKTLANRDPKIQNVLKHYLQNLPPNYFREWESGRDNNYLPPNYYEPMPPISQKYYPK